MPTRIACGRRTPLTSTRRSQRRIATRGQHSFPIPSCLSLATCLHENSLRVLRVQLRAKTESTRHVDHPSLSHGHVLRNGSDPSVISSPRRTGPARHSAVTTRDPLRIAAAAGAAAPSTSVATHSRSRSLGWHHLAPGKHFRSMKHQLDANQMPKCQPDAREVHANQMQMRARTRRISASARAPPLCLRTTSSRRRPPLRR